MIFRFFLSSRKAPGKTTKRLTMKKFKKKGKNLKQSSKTALWRIVDDVA